MKRMLRTPRIKTMAATAIPTMAGVARAGFSVDPLARAVGSVMPITVGEKTVLLRPTAVPIAGFCVQPAWRATMKLARYFWSSDADTQDMHLSIDVSVMAAPSA